MIFILLRNYLISKITHQWSLLHKEISKLLFQYGLHWWFYEHQNHNQSHSNQWRSAYQLIHKLFYCEVWEMVHVCMCVCVCVCEEMSSAHSYVKRNLIKTHLGTQCLGWLIIILTCVEWPKSFTLKSGMWLSEILRLPHALQISL